MARKDVPVFDDSKRHQMVRELRALYLNLVPLTALQWQQPHSSRHVEDEDGGGERSSSAAGAAPSCPCMVSFFDAFLEPDAGCCAIVVEYMDGGSLQDIVDSGGCGNEAVVANVAFRCLHGLAFLHDRRQIHR